jgi:hypothetical protein
MRNPTFVDAQIVAGALEAQPPALRLDGLRADCAQKPPSPALALPARPTANMASTSTHSEIGPGRFDLPQIQERLAARQAGLDVRSGSPTRRVVAPMSRCDARGRDPMTAG